MCVEWWIGYGWEREVNGGDLGEKNDVPNFNFHAFWFELLLFIVVFLFCELLYAHTKCFSSGPLVFAGPIFMNHREQALARLRSHPAQLKHKRDKHKGIWSSFSTRRDAFPTSSTYLSIASGKMHKPNSSTLLLSLLYSLRRKNMLKVYYLSMTVNLISLYFFLLTLIKRRHFTMYLFLFHFFSNFLRLRKGGKNNYGSLFYILYYLLLDDCHLAFCNPFFFF